MKFIKSFYKYALIIFSFFSLLSIIIPFENIPNWVNNQKESPLPEDLLNSEIISFTLDNTTNDIIYLINENDNSYFYINNKKIRNNFKEEIKYFSSPLIVYNNEYYFCSSSKNIIKMSQNGDIIKIMNTNYLDKYDNYELKCFYHSKEKVIVVAYINTPYVNSYDLIEAKWKEDNYQIQSDNVIKDANAYNVDNTDKEESFGLGVLYEGESKYNFIGYVYYYSKFIFGSRYLIDLNISLYSNIIFSFGNHDNPKKAFIFTYEPKVINKYNFYFLNMDWSTCVDQNGKLYLRMFKEAEIYNAYFIENSPILVYVIKKLDKSGITNFYIGAVDIENIVILYNIKIDSYKKLFYDNGYLYQNKGFLRYFEAGKQIEICPFIYNEADNNICQFFINEYQYYAFDSSSGLNENEKEDFCSNKKIFNYCLEECPIGFELINEECQSCISKPSSSYNYATQECTYEPNKNYPHEDNVYYNCADVNLKYFDYNCYESCSEIYGIMNPENNNECITCKSLNKIYFNNQCVDNCKEEEGYAYIEITINNEIYAFCQKCKEIDRYYFKGKCIEKCFEKQVSDKNNICYYCHEKNSTEKYYEDGKCVFQCDIGYETINDNISFCKNCKNEGKFYQEGKCVPECKKGYEAINENNISFCKNCKNEGKYYAHNNKCENSCEEYSLYYNDNNICYFCNETDYKFYEEGKCVSECTKGFGRNEELDICEFCHDKHPSMYYYNNTCIGKCPDYFGWEENDNICINCTNEKLLFKENKCVTTCGTYIRNGSICEPCPNTTKYFFEYNCYEDCPDFTIKEEKENYCRMCSNSYAYENGECVKECSEGYEKKKEAIGKIEVDVCFRCGSDNKTWYDGIKCTENCPKTKYASDDHFCRLCFCGFSTSNCDKYSDKCNCINDDENNENSEIFGDNCEYLSKKNTTKKKLSIIPIGSVISTKKSFFKFNLKNNAFDNANYTFSIKWKVFMNDKEITDLNNFATGVNEETFIINSDFLKSDKKNKIALELNLTDENNLNNTYYLNDEINISIQSLTQQQYTLIKSADSINKVMDNSFILLKNNLLGVEPYKFYYKILIKDEHNEIIPIKNVQELDSLLLKQELPYSFILPAFQEFIFELKNNREEKYDIIQFNKKNEYSPINHTLEDIIQGNETDNFTDIEKIFVIMKYIYLNKKDNISDSNYDLLLNFIEEKINKTTNEKGYYEDKEKIKQLNDSIRIFLNYYEPKTIFSLLNKIFLYQNTSIPDKYFNSFTNIFKIFINKLTEIKNAQILSNSDILSFFRSFDHLLDVYIDKGKIKEKYMIDQKEVFGILNKLSEYLIEETYPGETIRLVGKRISLFLSHLGKYQNHLSFSSVYNISDKLDYENYSTFSFDDYNINQETCDDEGNTLLCINNNVYKNFKQLVAYDSNIEDYSLIFFSINNNTIKTIQSGSGGNSFQIKLINKNKKDISNSYKNIGILYDIEFPFNYMTNSNTIKLYSSNNTEKDYSNITCVPKNNLYNDELYCLTYFNYETNTIKCSCNVIDEITYVSDYQLASFYKDIQSKIIFKSYEYLNKVNIIGVFSILIFLLLPNFFYLSYDLKNDVNKVNYKLLTFSEKIKKKYLEVKILNRSSVFSFAFYTSIFKFPLLSPLRQCDFKSPKYLKHFIITLALSYGIIISLILFIFLVPFEERKNAIDKRDIKNQKFDIINENVFLKYLNYGIVFSVFGAFITRFFIYIFGLILSYNNYELKYWKKIKKMFNYYVTYDIKDDILLGATWRKIKMRMLAYSNICGKFIFNKKLKKHRKVNKNFENYLFSSDRNNKGFNFPLLPVCELGEEMMELNENKKNIKYRAPSIDSKKSNKSQSNSKDKNNRKSVGVINDSIILPSATGINLKMVRAESLQLYGSKIKLDKSISKNKKYERIKKQYIIRKSTNKSLYENEVDNSSENKSYNYYTDLIKTYEYNLIYYSLDEFIPNKKLSKISKNTWKSSNTININYNPKGFCLLININILLTFLLLLLIFIVVAFIKLFLNNFGYFIINIWLGCSIFIYVIIYPILYLIKHFIGSILLFKFYHLKNRRILKPLYWLFVDKTMIYIFKVRNYVTKYKRELEYK